MVHQPQPISTAPQTYVPRLDVATHFNLDTRTTVLLHPRQHTVPDPFASKLGGHFAWPANEPWPQCSDHGDSFAAIFQLTKTDIPELEFPEGKDLFQLIWCPDYHELHDYGPKIHVTWRTIKEMGALIERRTYNHEPECDTHLPKECRLFPERVQETDPYIDEEQMEQIDRYILEHGQEDLDNMNVPNEYREDSYVPYFSAAPSTKVGGFMSAVQDPWYPTCSCGKEMKHLLTVASGDVGDDSSSYRWAPSDIDRDEEGEYISSAYRGSELCLGDMGGVYVYICRNCKDWPTATNHDSC